MVIYRGKFYRENYSCSYIKIAHHPHIFVLQVVAVIQKQPWVITKINQYPYSFTWHQQDCIFPAFVNITLIYNSVALNESITTSLSYKRNGEYL